MKSQSETPGCGEIWVLRHIPKDRPDKVKNRPFLVVSDMMPYDKVYVAPMTRSEPHQEDQPYVIKVEERERGWPQMGLSSTCYIQLHDIRPYRYAKHIFLCQAGVYPHMDKVKAILKETFKLN